MNIRDEQSIVVFLILILNIVLAATLVYIINIVSLINLVRYNALAMYKSNIQIYLILIIRKKRVFFVSITKLTRKLLATSARIGMVVGGR